MANDKMKTRFDDWETSGETRALLEIGAHDLLSLLKRVVLVNQSLLDYHYGRGKYNFSGLRDVDRGNAASDAWLELRDEIEPLVVEIREFLEVEDEQD